MDNKTKIVDQYFENPDIVTSKYLNNKCRVLLKQIEELKLNCQEMIMNRSNKEYTFIDGGYLSHIQPYADKDVDNVNVCRAMCSENSDCYGFNIYNNQSAFSKHPNTCEFISATGDIRHTGSIKRESGPVSVYIKINDENLKITKKILERLISEYQATCSRNTEIINKLELFTPSIVEGIVSYGDLTSKDEVIRGLKSDLETQKNKLKEVLNDADFLNKKHENSSLKITQNNIILSIYIIVIIILIIVILKINLVI